MTARVTCHAGRDGDCFWAKCPQVRDGEPSKTGRHCPLDTWCRDCDGHGCNECNGTGHALVARWRKAAMTWWLAIVGFVGVVAGMFLETWHANRAGRKAIPSTQELINLRHALATWCEAYEKAKPTGKYLKRREASLYAACVRVGTMWIRPDEPPSAPTGSTAK